MTIGVEVSPIWVIWVYLAKIFDVLPNVFYQCYWLKESVARCSIVFFRCKLSSKERGIGRDEAQRHNSMMILSAPVPSSSSHVTSSGHAHALRNATHKLYADMSPASVLRATPSGAGRWLWWLLRLMAAMVDIDIDID